MKTKRILIHRASEGTLSGVIHRVGLATLPVVNVTLPIRVSRVFGNGCPTPSIVREPMEVEVVLIGGREYVVQPPYQPTYAGHEKEEGRVTIHHDNPAVFATPCPGEFILLDS